MKDVSFRTRAVSLLLAAAFGATQLQASVSTPQLPDPGDTGVTREKQEQIGRQAAAEVYRRMPVLSDSSTVTQYVRQLGRKLMANIPPEYNWPYEFHVIPQKEINAFALPGGPVFINLGSILAADNEAELAGVMAHEMSHVYMQHSIKQMKKTQMTRGITGVLGAVLGSMGGAAGALGQMGAGVAGGVLTMKYSRADEAQADAVGAIIMYKANYDPRYLARFFQKLASMGSSQPQFLSDHPSPGNRTQAIEDEVRSWPAKDFVNDSEAFVQAKAAARGQRAYSSQEIAQGARSGAWGQQNRQDGSMPAGGSRGGNGGNGGDISNVSYREIQPSDNFRTFAHNLFTISYPDNWRIMRDPEGDGVTVAPSAGMMQGTIAYGAIINSADTKAASLDQKIDDIVSSLEQSNPALRARGRPQPVRVNSIEGRSVDLAGESPIEQDGRPQPEHDWLVALPRPDGNVLYAVFIAPERDFSELRPTFESMLRSLHLR
ncbi:MAG: M48 family metallopeptidase [Terriglobales bacterium]